MIIITDAHGNILNNLVEQPIYQGSNKANQIILVAPFSKTVEVFLRVELPSKEVLEPILMRRLIDHEFEQNVWTADVIEAMTEQRGKVGLQFSIVAGGEKTNSFGCSFNVLKGVPPVLPVAPTQTIYEQILYALSEINSEVDIKQNKDTTGDDNEISITEISDTKKVVEAINKLGERAVTNTSDIEQNAFDISANNQEIEDLKGIVGTGQEYIGTMRGSSLPTQTALSDFVVEEKSRPANGGDMIIFIWEREGTDKNYKYNYNGSVWDSYEIPLVELAKNGTAGLVSGTYGVGSTNNTIVDIAGGVIEGIYVKDGDVYRSIREFLLTNKTNIANIVTGATSVGNAIKAVKDKLGNDIVDTYLTQNAGATKRYVRDYSLPKIFNDTFFITSDGFTEEVPSKETPQFSVLSESIGDTVLFELEKDAGAEYELSRKNSANNTVSVSADRNVDVRFRITTFAKQDVWIPLAVALSNKIEMQTGEIVKIDFNSEFSLVGDEILELVDSDKIKQVLEVVRETSVATTFDIYSNETYPSTFGLNTQTQRIVVAQGELGEQEVIEAEGTIENDYLVFDLSEVDLNTNTEAFFDLSVATVEELDDDLEVIFDFGRENIRIATPYNFESGEATVGMLKQVFTAFGGGFQKWAFKGFIREIGSDLVCFAELDDLSDIESDLDDFAEDLENLEEEVAGKEDTFAKNTAFNKDFGTDAENIAMNGQASVGVSENVSREDHAHPSDTTKADDSVVVKITAQELTEAEKSQARSNIGAGASGFSGIYDDLSNKPIIRADLSVTVASGELLHQHSGASSGGLISGSLYKAKDGAWELVSVGKEYIDNALHGIAYLKDPDKTYLVIKTPADNDTFTLFTGTINSPNYTVEWGDGESENITTDKPTHEYATAGMYLITISGAFDGIQFSVGANVNKNKIIEVYGGSNYRLIINNNAFHTCRALTTVNFPNATLISTQAFYTCSSLTTANFPNATGIGDYAFRGCTSLTTANFPNATSIGIDAFASCSSLKELTLGNVTDTAAGTRFQNVKLVNLTIAQDVTNTDIDRIKQFYADNGGTFIGNETKHGLQVEKAPTADNDVVRKVDLKDTQTYTTTLPTTSSGASDWQAVTGGYELAKTISGLTVYDSIVSVADDDTIWTDNELNATITTDTLTFFVSSLPSAEVGLTLTITKSINGGTL